MNKNKSIQKALAILITHPDIAENYTDFRKIFISDLNLNLLEVNLLDEFYESNKDKFTASARILKKNRWDDIKLSLPIITRLIEKKKLDTIWTNYIGRNNIQKFTPKNPLIESILFAEFAEISLLISPIEQQVIKYERIRNEVTYNHHEDFSECFFEKKILINEEGIDKTSVYIHPCYRFEDFEFDIPTIINENKVITTDKYLKGACTILFFKNLNKEGIGTLKISNDIKNIIQQITTTDDLLTTYQFYQQKLTPNEFVRFLSNLEKTGVLSFTKNKEEV